MEIQSMIIAIIGAVVTALITWIITELSIFINTKIKNTKLQSSLNAALSVVSSVVKSTYQTYVDNIKGTDAWTAEAQKIALEKAMETAKSQLSAEVQDYLIKTYGSIDAWLQTQIEAEIFVLKLDNNL